MQLPEKFKTGETLKSDIGPKLNRIIDCIKSIIPHGDQSTIAVNTTPGGSFFSALRRGGSGAGGGDVIQIAKITSRTGARTYLVDIFSRWESDYSLSNDYRIATGETMKTPCLDDSAAADQLAAGTILQVRTANINGTAVWVPIERVGLA
jgi:hypothetical protein